MNWDAVLRELRASAAEAQDRANRMAVEGDPMKVAIADQTAEILRALLRAVSAGVR